ncbi:MAG: hypothetical protein ACRECC_12785 [Pseudolabrys sp.]
MSFLTRGLFVVGGIILGTTALNYFVFGNSADYGLPNSRLGAWREAQVRPACYRALEAPERDMHRPRLPSGQHRIAFQDYSRMVEMTAALHCYLVTQGNAVCEKNNRAYIVDYIGKYYDKMDSMLKIAGRYGDDEVRNVRQLWNGDNNRAIAAALEKDIRFGRLSKSDFGWSAPDALKPLFQQYSDAKDICPQEHPWVAAKL